MKTKPINLEDALDFLMSVSEYVSLEAGRDQDGHHVKLTLGGDQWDGLFEPFVGSDLPSAVEKALSAVASHTQRRLELVEDILGKKANY